MGAALVEVVIGVAAVIGGGALIVYRGRLAQLNAETQHRVFGRVARSSARKSTPANVALVGLAAIVIGIAMTISGMATFFH